VSIQDITYEVFDFNCETVVVEKTLGSTLLTRETTAIPYGFSAAQNLAKQDFAVLQ